MQFRIRRNELSRSEIIKSVNKDFKNSFHNINKSKQSSGNKKDNEDTQQIINFINEKISEKTEPF